MREKKVRPKFQCNVFVNDRPGHPSLSLHFVGPSLFNNNNNNNNFLLQEIRQVFGFMFVVYCWSKFQMFQMNE